MKYSEKVKRSQAVVKAIKALKDSEVLEFVYGKKRNYQTDELHPAKFEIRAFELSSGGFMYSVSSVGRYGSMSVDKITPTTIKLYTFDMMGTRTSYNLPMYEMKIGLTITEDNED